MVTSRYLAAMAWVFCAELAYSQPMETMGVDVAQNRWLSFYENLNGLLAKLATPMHSIDFNASADSNQDTFNSLIGLATIETNQGRIEGYEELGNLTTECASDEDCHKVDVELSCVGADAFRNGRCVTLLKPSEHGCEYDDQCRKTCKESYCSTDDRFRNDRGENQCRCQKGTYFLWKKCWKSCVPGTRPILQNDEWSCQEQDPHVARASTSTTPALRLRPDPPRLDTKLKMDPVAQGAVRFFGPYDQPRSARLEIRNSTLRPVIFRLKCSNPIDFSIDPSGVGILRPKDKQPLTLVALPDLDRSGDCTLVLEIASVDIVEQEGEMDDVTAWSYTRMENLSTTAIKTIFGPNAKADEESETTVIVINETMLHQPEKHASVAETIWRVRNRYQEVWRYLLIFLLLLAITAFLCGLWLGSRSKPDRQGAEASPLLSKTKQM